MNNYDNRAAQIINIISKLDDRNWRIIHLQELDVLTKICVHYTDTERSLLLASILEQVEDRLAAN